MRKAEQYPPLLPWFAEAKFEVITTVGMNNKYKSMKEQAGATIAMTIPTKDDIPRGLLPILMVLGYPTVPPSSFTPLVWDRIRAFWEFGKAPVHGELSVQSITHAREAAV